MLQIYGEPELPNRGACLRYVAWSWLAAIPAEPATPLAPQAMQLALRRRLRMPLPICHGRCGPTHGCGAQVDRLGDHALACPRTGLLARRAKVVERAWVRVAREAVGAEGQVVPQQWLVHTTAPGVRAEDRRRLDLVIYGATPNGSALCCDATLVSPLTRTGQPQPCAADVDGAALRTAERRKAATYPELQGAGPRSSSYLEAKSEGASTAIRTVWYETCFGYGLTEHRRLYGPQRLQAGRVAGGACCLSQCSRRLPALPSASRGRSRRMPPASRALRSTAYSTSPRPKGRAACRCDPRRSSSV